MALIADVRLSSIEPAVGANGEKEKPKEMGSISRRMINDQIVRLFKRRRRRVGEAFSRSVCVCVARSKRIEFIENCRMASRMASLIILQT